MTKIFKDLRGKEHKTEYACARADNSIIKERQFYKRNPPDVVCFNCWPPDLVKYAQSSISSCDSCCAKNL